MRNCLQILHYTNLDIGSAPKCFLVSLFQAHVGHLDEIARSTIADLRAGTSFNILNCYHCTESRDGDASMCSYASW
jgi:hypothetical protein